MSNIAAFKVKAQSRSLKLGDYDSNKHSYYAKYVHPKSYVLHLQSLAPTKVVMKYPKDSKIPIHLPGRNGKNGRYQPPINPIKYTELLIPEFITAFDWEITKKGGGFHKKISKKVKHLKYVGAVVSEGISPTVHVPGTGRYTITLRLRGSSYTSKQEFHLKDFLVVSIGDSYASGEGNPDIAGAPKKCNVDVGSLFDFPDWPNLPKKLYECVKRMIEDNSTLNALLGKPPIDMEVEPVWLDEKAHRSLRSGPARAARLLENKDNGDLITFLSFARSGDTIKGGLLSAKDDSWTNIGQLEKVRKTIGTRTIDALLISIGGDDIGFSGRLEDLVTKDVGSGDLENKLWNYALGRNFSSANRQKVEKELNDIINKKLDNWFELLAQEINKLNVRQVYITEYPTALFDKKENNKVVTDHGCGMFYQFSDAEIDRSDALLIKKTGIKLNKKLKEIAKTHKWIYVGGVAKGFSGHGYCADGKGPKGPFFVSATESLAMQGDINGTMHPNVFGHNVYARQIQKSLQENHFMEPGLSDIKPIIMKPLKEKKLPLKVKGKIMA